VILKLLIDLKIWQFDDLKISSINHQFSNQHLIKLI